MTGQITTYGGETWQLPPLLAWEVQRTDGDPCGSASVTFLYEPARLGVLKSATRLRLARDGETAFFGVVDEFEAEVTSAGRRVTLTARSPAALMMDCELRAATYPVLTLAGALQAFAVPCGVTKTASDALPPVYNFSVETGTTCWQALCGFCRHSAGTFPRFSADGTLLLKKGGDRWQLNGAAAFESAVWRSCRYGVIARQTVVTPRGGTEVAENAPFLKIGGTAQRVSMRTGDTLDARWRTARQRVEDAQRGAATLTVTLGSGFAAEPGDTMEVDLPTAGIKGSFTLRAITDRCADGKQSCILEMEGSLV